MWEWLKQILEAAGVTLTDDTLHKLDAAAPEHVVTKQEFDGKAEELAALQTQLTQRDADIENLKKSAGTPEELQTQLNDLQAKYDADTQALKENLDKQKFDSALDIALSGAKAKNPKAVKALLESDKLKLAEDGKLEGLTDQLSALKTSDGYLFDDGGFKGKEPPAALAPPPDQPATLGGAIAAKLADQLK